MYDYPATLRKQPDGGFTVTFADVPEAITEGNDREDALMHAVNSLETALSFYVDGRKPLPIPSRLKRGQIAVRPSALETAKLAIYAEMLTQGVKKAELARRLGWHQPQVDRLLKLKHASRMEQLEAAAQCLGRQIRLTVI